MATMYPGYDDPTWGIQSEIQLTKNVDDVGFFPL